MVEVSQLPEEVERQWRVGVKRKLAERKLLRKIMDQGTCPKALGTPKIRLLPIGPVNWEEAMNWPEMAMGMRS